MKWDHNIIHYRFMQNRNITLRVYRIYDIINLYLADIQTQIKV